MQNHILVDKLISNVLSNTLYEANITIARRNTSAISVLKAHAERKFGARRAPKVGIEDVEGRNSHKFNQASILLI
jgi:hypothetical protein